jgi:DNA helicase-2/ATP-dependent DNA helicase PcrA
MINSATLMIREQDYVKQTLQAKFPWLLIDEYQDLGKSLHEMVLELQAVTEIKVFAVGDMNQSIYGFSGAYPDFLEELNNLDDFNSIQLENNYRSNQGIIEGSLDMLTSSPSRPNYSAKKRVNEDADFTFITCKAEMQAQCEIAAQKIIPKLKAKGISYNEIGILVASSNDVVQMATSLNDYKIPFYIVKWDFVKSDIVNWLQDCAKWCQDAKLQSFDDLFGFWKSQLKRHEHERSTWEVIQQRVHFYETLKTSKEKTSVLEWLNHIFSELDLKKVFEESSYYPEENENLDLLLNEAENKNLKDSPLKRLAFLGKPEDEVTITTRHSSKGLEFEVIIMLGMEEGRFPYTHQVKEDSRQMQEAHRLCYVCVSRAKRECILVMSQKHTIQTRSGPWTIKYEPSRFWVLLMERFGNDKNRFNSGNY